MINRKSNGLKNKEVLFLCECFIIPIESITRQFILDDPQEHRPAA